MDALNGIDVFRDESQRVPYDVPLQSISRRPRTPSQVERLHKRKDVSGVYTPDRFGFSPITDLSIFSYSPPLFTVRIIPHYHH